LSSINLIFYFNLIKLVNCKLKLNI